MMRWLTVFLRVIIGGIFVWAGMSKAWNLEEFAQAVGGYRLIPHTEAAVIALYLPWLEIVCGGALMFGRLRYGSVAMLSALLLVFLTALASAWWRGLDIDCGCFNLTTGAGYLWPISRSLLILVGLFYLVLHRPHQKGLGSMA